MNIPFARWLRSLRWGALLSVMGGIIAVIAFFTPWSLTEDTTSGDSGTATAWNLVTQGSFSLNSVTLLVYLLAAVLAIVCGIAILTGARQKRYFDVLRWAAAFGLASMLLNTRRALENGYDSGTLVVTLQAGFWVSLIGYLIAAIGAFLAREAFMKGRQAQIAQMVAAARPWNPVPMPPNTPVLSKRNRVVVIIITSVVVLAGIIAGIATTPAEAINTPMTATAGNSGSTTTDSFPTPTPISDTGGVGSTTTNAIPTNTPSGGSGINVPPGYDASPAAVYLTQKFGSFTGCLSGTFPMALDITPIPNYALFTGEVRTRTTDGSIATFPFSDGWLQNDFTLSFSSPANPQIAFTGQVDFQSHAYATLHLYGNWSQGTNGGTWSVVEDVSIGC